MKLILLSLVLTLTAPALAAVDHKVKWGSENQEIAIKMGLAQGLLTKDVAARLEAKQERYWQAKARLEKRGPLSARARRLLELKKFRLSYAIDRQLSKGERLLPTSR